MKRIIKDLEKLHEPSEPLKVIAEDGSQLLDEGKDILSKLDEIFDKKPEVVALAAPQIGINKRVFGIRFNDGVKYFINPIIKQKSGLMIAPEVFVSAPGKEYLIGRPKEITVAYRNKEFKYEDNKLLDRAARVFDQMAQLLDGVLPGDLGLESDVEVDGSLANATDEELASYCEIWKKYVSVKLNNLEAEINSSETTKKLYQELRFSESVINGRISVYEENKQPRLNYKQRRALKKLERRAKK